MDLIIASIATALSVLFWVVFIQAILSWIPGLASGTGPVAAFDRAASRIVDPLLEPIRRRLPGGSALDFSPLVLMVLIQVARWVLVRLAFG